MDPETLKHRIVEEALALGCCAVRVAAARPIPPANRRLAQWIQRGFGADMDYLAQTCNVRSDLRAFWSGAKSVVCIAVPYALETPAPPVKGVWGYVASYARGPDYHRTVGDILQKMGHAGQALGGPEFRFKACVDSQPIPERSLARACGLGWLAHNTALMVAGWGTRVLLGELLTNVALEPDPPMNDDPCGSCRDCIEACPTGALVEPGLLDARRCLSYLTVEARGLVPSEFRSSVALRLFGCDTCQTVCPANAIHPENLETRTRNRADHTSWPQAWVNLKTMLSLGSRALKKTIGNTALQRLSRARLRRNIAVILGNVTEEHEVQPMIDRLAADPSNLVREHAHWALARRLQRETA